MNPNCRIYALPSLCYSILSICRTPEVTNHQFLINREHFDSQFQPSNYSGSLYDSNKMAKKKSISSHKKYPPTRNTENVQRICPADCQLLEHELCQKEYAIAKRHPTIGLKLQLEDCNELPNDSDCLKLGINIDVHADNDCFWDVGMNYRGLTNLTATGKSCLKWARLMREISNYPELAGHNFCRNPGAQQKQPWCYIDQAKTVELCDVPKCSGRMWLYGITAMSFVLIIIIIAVSIVCIKTFRKRNTSTIQNVSIFARFPFTCKD